jgi:CRISPR/Cas system CSM-associated protein Csm3 (group 7 of RAMP superfamily)
MDIRYIAKIVIEAETPLSIGTGKKGLTTDSLVAKDANNLPYIPGTGLCGVLRHTFNALDKELKNDLFGFAKDEKGTGSRVKVSSAHLIGEDGIEVVEGFKIIHFESDYYKWFNKLPERDHVRITDRGVADTKEHGKFEEELIHKGTRFAFEIELVGTENDAAHWQQLLDLLASPIFRIGSGTRKGFGKIKVVKDLSVSKIFNLKDKAHLLDYLKKSSSLNFDSTGWRILDLTTNEQLPNWTKYTLSLKPKDFFLFSAGFGDEDAESKPKTERYFDWSSGKPEIESTEYWLIPATSVKGAISHRVAYHYNKLNNEFIGKNSALKTELDTDKVVEEFVFEIDENLPFDSPRWKEMEDQIQAFDYKKLTKWEKFENELDAEVDKIKANNLPVCENNDAVVALFGFTKDSQVKKEGLRGRVIINDIYLTPQSCKVFNHTKIDRFTNGTIDGALFKEKVAAYDDFFTLDIWVENTALQEPSIKKAFENSLKDLVEGQLQLGGNTTKGHGVFTGTLV